MEPGCAGTVATVTLKVLAALVPQVLDAVTEILPPVVPAVAVIEVEVELPVHPAGKVQLYDVAPDTGAML